MKIGPLKISPYVLVAIIAVVIFAIGLGLAGTKPKEIAEPPAPTEEEQPQPNETVPPREPFQTAPTTCGDGLCRAEERCNADTGETACPEDCGYTCPAELIIVSDPDTRAETTELNSYFCGDGNCQQSDENDFVISDSTSIKTVVVNIGEKFASDVRSNFVCEKVGTGISASRDDQLLAGLIVKDNFNGKQSASLSGKPQGNNVAEYSLQFNYTDAVKSMDLYCYITLNSDELLNQQGINIVVNPA